jgi:hypothetical protein
VSIYLCYHTLLVYPALLPFSPTDAAACNAIASTPRHYNSRCESEKSKEPVHVNGAIAIWDPLGHSIEYILTIQEDRVLVLDSIVA